jgi:hypothetical protein
LVIGSRTVVGRSRKSKYNTVQSCDKIKEVGKAQRKERTTGRKEGKGVMMTEFRGQKKTRDFRLSGGGLSLAGLSQQFAISGFIL